MIAKFPYIRSLKLMALYRTIPCQCCLANDGTVCGAHSNQGKHGHGRGIKASDIYCASLCSKCHYELDQGKRLNRAEKNLLWWLAHVATIQLLRDKWPENIPLPEINNAD